MATESSSSKEAVIGGSQPELPRLAKYPRAVGDVVASKYRLDSVLGASGMGVVFAATHLQIEQKVAIKFLLDRGGMLDETLRRFALEAKIMAKIRSRHVVQVLDVGSIDDSIPYIVMEHLTGADLSQVSRREGLTLHDAISYMLQACEGLAAAHAAGVIHRDIKPSNLFLVAEADGTRTIRVIDFGVAKFRGGDSNPGANDGTLTQTATFIGSPRYMSPEQAIESRDVDARADVWSLGVILHELLTGMPLFKAASMTQVLVNVVSMPIPHPSDLAAYVPRALGDAVMHALSRERRRRTPSVAVFAREIAPFAGQQERDRVGRIHHVVESSASLPLLSAEDASEALARVSNVGTGTSGSWGSNDGGEKDVAETEILAASAAAEPAARARRSRARGLMLVGALVAALGIAGVLAVRTRAVAAPSSPSPSTSPAAFGAPHVAPVLQLRLAVPAGARVEVDGVAAVVTDDAIVLAGTLGTAHRVKAVVSGRTIETMVAISEDGLVPPSITLPAPVAPVAPVASTASWARTNATAKPVVAADSAKSPPTPSPPPQATGLVRSFE